MVGDRGGAVRGGRGVEQQASSQTTSNKKIQLNRDFTKERPEGDRKYGRAEAGTGGEG